MLIYKVFSKDCVSVLFNHIITVYYLIFTLLLQCNTCAVLLSMVVTISVSTLQALTYVNVNRDIF